MTIFGNLKKGDIVIDCGAHIGDVTNILAYEGATVYAFEPMPDSFRVLNKRFKKYNNVKCINSGLSNVNGKVKLFLSKEYDGSDVKRLEGGSIYSTKSNVDKHNSVNVTIVDIVDFVREFDGNIKLLKINAEGAEYPILKRLINTGCINKIDRVVVALHGSRIPGLYNKLNSLRSLCEDYNILNIDWDWWSKNRIVMKRNIRSLGKQLVFGLGIDNYSIKNLSGFLNAQNNVSMFHEYTTALPWVINNLVLKSKLRNTLLKDGIIVGYSCINYLNYVESILRVFPNTKFVCLKRFKKDFLESKLKRSHAKELNDNQYYDLYFKRINKLIRRHPDNVICVNTHEGLYTREGNKDIFRFIKLPKRNRIYWG